MGRKEKQPVREVEETEIEEEGATAPHVDPQLTLPSSDLSTLITSIQQLTAQQAAFMKETQIIHERLAHNQEEMRAQSERLDRIERRSQGASVHGPGPIPQPARPNSPSTSQERPKETNPLSVPDLLKGLQQLISQATGAPSGGTTLVGEGRPSPRGEENRNTFHPPPRPAGEEGHEQRQGVVRPLRPQPERRGLHDPHTESDELGEDEEGFYDDGGYPYVRGQLPRRGRMRRGRQERPRDEAPLPLPRMECPTFNGTKVRDWVCKVEKYFQCQRVAHEQKIDRAMMYFEDNALHWYQYTMRKTPNQGWDQFRAGLIERFERASQRDFNVQLNSLKQTGTVLEYQDQFERLSCLVEDWNEDALVGAFIAGLQPEIRLAVQTQESRDLRICMKVARDKEEKMELKRAIRKDAKGYDPHRARTLVHSKANFKKKATPPPQHPPRKVTYITKEERDRRFQQGLCYNCEEKWHKGHECKKKRLYAVLEDDEEPPTDDDSSEDEVPPEVLVEAAIGEETSCHSLTDPSKAKAMRVRGYVNQTRLVVLLDSGATHNFMSLEVANKLGCRIEPQAPFTVMVGDGSKLPCEGRCKDLELVMNKVPFKVDVFVLPLGGVDIVLGIQWLETLGVIHWDFANLRMSFTKDGDEERVTLTATNSSVKPRAALKALVAQQPAFWLVAMATDVPAKEEPTEIVPIEIQHVLKDFIDLFEEPSYASEDCDPIEEMDEEEGDDQQTGSESSDQGDEYSKASQHSEDERLTTNEIEDQSSDESCKEWGDDYGDPSPNDHSSSSPHEYRGFTLAETRLYHPRISNFTFGYATSSGTTHKRESNYCEPLLPLVGHNRLHNYSPQNSTNPLRCGPTKAASLQPSTAISLQSTSSHSKPNKNQKIHNRADQQKGNKLKDILATSDLGRRPKPRTRSNFVNGPSLKTGNRNQQLSKEPLKDPLPAAYNLREAIRKIQSSTKPDKMQQQKKTSSRVPVRNKMPIPAKLERTKHANVLSASPAMVRKKEQVAKAPEGAKVGDDGTATIRAQPPAEKPHFTLTDALTMIRRIVVKNDELLEQMYVQRQNEQRTFLSASAHGQGNGPQQEQAENSDESDEEDEAVATREKPTGQFPTSKDKISDLLKDLKTGEHQTLERRNENIKNAEIHENKELAPMDHIGVAATLYDQLESIPWSTFTASEASSKEDGDDNTNFSARKNGNCGQLEGADLGQNVLKQLPNTTFVLKTNNSLHMPTFAHYLKAEVHPQVRLIFDHGKSIQGSATKCYKELHKRMESQLGRLPIDYGPCYPLLLIGWFKAKLENELAALGDRCRARPKRLKGQVYDRGRLHGAAILSDNPRHQDQRGTLLGLLQRDYGPARSKAWLDKSGRLTLGDCQGRAWGQARSKGGWICYRSA
ncbi:uncharacterized protein LOC116249553 [Nymphaea colorata]|nr:uncharacterized protein LOC116249553 [Nymphaea colorata]XP_049932567.1 uncharacterized protein LOC116249553 [Nymphaea colorata]XP_049932568.1 uncharacterized protein LOC116249553 [Nymphaea colorata]XP_049932569.1 uncharacterized protein LOC116249553 [Nymphaea colorata]XP_049932570.1 uncharacterized protein LOC116249553 [Nymphaea colorata]XP_049932571.1 uncharacterized protein LOC116249553 [Nymphaea colorata]XP_049932572.1 uncharacterized protein LOC116249553 [Nymphaea colorata]XP_04993257